MILHNPTFSINNFKIPTFPFVNGKMWFIRLYYKNNFTYLNTKISRIYLFKFHRFMSSHLASVCVLILNTMTKTIFVIVKIQTIFTKYFLHFRHDLFHLVFSLKYCFYLVAYVFYDNQAFAFFQPINNKTNHTPIRPCQFLPYFFAIIFL